MRPSDINPNIIHGVPVCNRESCPHWHRNIMERRLTVGKAEFLGAFFSDVAMVVVGDPCKLIREEGPYDRFCEAGLTGDESTFRECWTVPMKGDTEAVAVRTYADGWIRVWLERHPDGKPMRLIVDLTPWCEPMESDHAG